MVDRVHERDHDPTGSDRRRHRSWLEALKQGFEPSASVSRVARRYHLNTEQLFRSVAQAVP
jgi:transposase-like protein